MTKRSDKLTRAAHIKRNTRGTSNELSFSVLDAAKNALDEGKERPTEESRRFGRISLFTLPAFGRKKSISTPKKEESLPLSGAALPPTATGTPQTVKPADAADGGALHASPAASSVQVDAPAAPAPSVPEPFARAQRSTGRTSEEEIAWRKGRRRRHRLVIGAICAAIIVALVASGVLYLYNDTMRYQRNTQQLEQAAEQLASTDELLATLDEALTDPLGDDAAAFYAERRDEVEQGVTALEAAERTASDAMQGLRESREKEVADSLMSASSSRVTMLEQGWAILEAGDGVADDYQAFEDAWAQVLEADELARESAELISAGSQDAIAESKQKSQEALDALTAARSTMDSIAQATEGIEVEAQLAYLDKRIEALGYAIASDAALEARDTGEAQAQNDAYNAADQEAAALAEALPENPGQPVLDAFQRKIADNIESYEAARGQASTSDAILRDYLGASSK